MNDSFSSGDAARPSAKPEKCSPIEEQPGVCLSREALDLWRDYANWPTTQEPAINSNSFLPKLTLTDTSEDEGPATRGFSGGYPSYPKPIGIQFGGVAPGWQFRPTKSVDEMPNDYCPPDTDEGVSTRGFRSGGNTSYYMLGPRFLKSVYNPESLPVPCLAPATSAPSESRFDLDERVKSV